MWLDFGPDDEIVRDFVTANGVVTAIRHMADLLTGFRSLHWIKPSFILLGIRPESEDVAVDYCGCMRGIESCRRWPTRGFDTF